MNIQQEIIDAPGPQPVLVVEVEPDYWHRGHYCEGSKSYINPLEVWKLPVGTKLYTAPPHQSEHHLEMVNTPAPSVPGGHVYVYVSGLTGSGKSAVAGEIEIALRASGLDVEWVDSESEKHLTHADYTSALELYRPKVRIFEKNISAAPTPAEAPADVARDAGRYRWLRRENAKPGLGFYVGDDTDTMPGDITWIGSDLDAAIDAAIAAEKGQQA